VEGTPAFGKALPFAGRCRNEGLGRVTRTAGTSSSLFDDSMTVRGARVSSHEEGNLHLGPAITALRQQMARCEGPSLGAARPVQSSVVTQRPSPQTVVGSRRCPQAASRSDDGIRGHVLSRACSAAGLASKGLQRLAAIAKPSSTGEGHQAPKRAGRKKRTPKRCGGSESTFCVTTKGTLKQARIGCSGVCPCVGSAVAEVVRRSPDPEKRRPVIRVNIARGSVGGDGGLARGTSGKAKACSGAAGKGATRAGSSRKHT